MTCQTLYWSRPYNDPLLSCPDSFRPLVFVCMCYDWHHPAAVSLHCPVHIMALVLTCHELPIICMNYLYSAMPYNLSVLAQICSCWFFEVCSSLPCLVPFSDHTFPCSVWLCIPCPECRLAQNAAMHHRKLLFLARFLTVI